jgi:hypothetical protein
MSKVLLLIGSYCDRLAKVTFGDRAATDVEIMMKPRGLFMSVLCDPVQ